MQRNTLLIVMVAAGSAMCWWPKIIPPNRDLPGWKTPLILIALITGLGTGFLERRIGDGFSSRRSWAELVGYAVASGFGGQPMESMRRGFHGLLSYQTSASIPVSIIALFAGVALRDSKITTKNRRLLWGTFLVSFAFAPTVCAFTPLLTTLRK